ncbi:hypothetical protein BC834DRAFT_181167 [Gloeopeniophorella convolvens]|nr:hypothetical protein BC834DRAFT_181167 [Gloeopeniophorella convolvens]
MPCYKLWRGKYKLRALAIPYTARQPQLGYLVLLLRWVHPVTGFRCFQSSPALPTSCTCVCTTLEREVYNARVPPVRRPYQLRRILSALGIDVGAAVQ